MQAGAINEGHIEFFKKNMKKNPGRSRLKLVMVDQVEKLVVQMRTTEKGFEMNDEMADFLENNPLIEVQVDAV
jgi:DNA polymerase-3 subunit alpha